MCVHFEPFVVGYKLTRVNLGSIKNQSGGLDSGIITSIELSSPIHTIGSTLLRSHGIIRPLQ